MDWINYRDYEDGIRMELADQVLEQLITEVAEGIRLNRGQR